MFFIFSMAWMACNNESKPDAPDTGLLVQDTGEVTEACAATILDQSPQTGSGGWFYRDSVTVVFSALNGAQGQLRATSVFIEAAMSSRDHYKDLLMSEQEHEKAIKMRHIKQVFQQMDEDNSGEITLDEME